MAEIPDRRSGARHHPIFELSVREHESGRDLGLLVDASPVGLRLASPEPLEEGLQLKLSIEAGVGDDHATVTCDAVVRWCKSSASYPNLNIIGLALGSFDSTESENRLLHMLLAECIQPAA
ncbi:MAG: hypothetical protein ACI8QS_000003 [Planctomycetota bacterium]|jgi:hypothetical protein